MKTFRDMRGEQWTINFTVAALRRVRDLAGVDFGDPAGGIEAMKALQDPVRLVDTLAAVLRPELESRGVSDEDFADRLAGESLEEAANALLDDIADFSRDPKDREIARRISAVAKAAADQARVRVEAKLADLETPEGMRKLLEASGLSSTSAPESSA